MPHLCRLRANLHFTLWMCIADDSSKVKGVKAVFICISSKMTSEQSSARLYFWWKWKDDSFVVGGNNKSRFVLKYMHLVTSKQHSDNTLFCHLISCASKVWKCLLQQVPLIVVSRLPIVLAVESKVLPTTRGRFFLVSNILQHSSARTKLINSIPTLPISVADNFEN
jgi:hypothetical protein